MKNSYKYNFHSKESEKGLFPEIIKLIVAPFVSPFYNLFLSIRYRSIIHPFARISKGVKFGKYCTVAKARLSTYYGGKILIGNRTSINDACEFFAHQGAKITIGDYCVLAKRTTIMTRAHVFDDPNQRIINQGYYDSDVEIGSDVWTGLDVKILPGVKIGDGCVMGANAVVTRDIPSMSVAVGIPAKVIRKRGE